MNSSVASAAAAEANPACPDLARWQARELYGLWRVELSQLGERGTLVLRQHPEFAASLRGEFNIAGVHSIASGDVEEGEFNLDESRDGKRLSAFWTGRLDAASCGREIRGSVQRLPVPGQRAVDTPFVLRRDHPARDW
ncbi:hypothetical protein [Comamonas badia]|uniref:hypothetical protein n=1 Tax=Comamonas badia TaxID=265291 RepID=UPI000412500A|nr:hypothetical protein [Comamonas badia]